MYNRIQAKSQDACEELNIKRNNPYASSNHFEKGERERAQHADKQCNITRENKHYRLRNRHFQGHHSLGSIWSLQPPLAPPGHSGRVVFLSLVKVSRLRARTGVVTTSARTRLRLKHLHLRKFHFTIRNEVIQNNYELCLL